MNIKSAELRTGLSRRMIRHYEEAGLITPARNESSYRTFTLADIERLLCIKAMREVGFSIDEIGQILREDKTADVLNRHLNSLLATQEESFRRQRSRIAQIKQLLSAKIDPQASHLLDRIAWVSAAKPALEGVDSLQRFLNRQHIVHGHIDDLVKFEKHAVFGDDGEFRIVDTTYIKYKGFFSENAQTCASLAICREIYSYLLLFTDSSSQFDPKFHRQTFRQFSEQWRKASPRLSLDFEAMTEDVGALENLFSHFDLAIVITAESPAKERIQFVIPGQPLFAYLRQTSHPLSRQGLSLAHAFESRDVSKTEK